MYELAPRKIQNCCEIKLAIHIFTDEIQHGEQVTLKISDDEMKPVTSCKRIWFAPF